MARKTMKMLLLALVAAFALSSVAEAATAPPKRTVRHRTKHSSRVASGASTTTAKKPAPKRPSAAARARSQSQANRSTTATTAKKPVVKKPAPAPRRQTTKPR